MSGEGGPTQIDPEVERGVRYLEIQNDLSEYGDLSGVPVDALPDHIIALLGERQRLRTELRQLIHQVRIDVLLSGEAQSQGGENKQILDHFIARKLQVLHLYYERYPERQRFK